MRKEISNKILLNGSKISWFNIDLKTLQQKLRSVGIHSYTLREEKFLDYLGSNAESLKINEIYKGFRLYDLTIYSICNELLIFKDELDIDAHSHCIAKWFAAAKNAIEELDLIFQRNIFSLVLVINGHSLIDACFLALSKKYNYPFLCIENTSNKNKIVWDDITGKVVTYNLSKHFFLKFQKSLNKRNVSSYISTFLNSITENKKDEHLSNLERVDVPFIKPYLLFIGQVYTDAAQLFAIEDDFLNPIDVIKTAIHTSHQLDLPVVLKLHPKEINGVSPIIDLPYDSPTYKRVSSFKSENVYIDYRNEYNTFKLIEQSRLVVTLNSQAGLEACLFNKPVLSYKNCFYSGVGFTVDYVNKKSLSKEIRNVVNNKNTINKNLGTAQNFFYIFFEKYCIDRSVGGLLHRLILSGNFRHNVFIRFSILKFLWNLK